MITIRLQRRGRKNDPSFRVIVVDSHRAAKTGNYLEMVGSYDPRTDRIELNSERIKHWISEGATLSGTVHNLLVSNKIIDAKKVNVLPKKTVAKKEEEAAPAEAVAPEAAQAAEAPAEAETPAADDAPAPAAPSQSEAEADKE